MKSTTFSKVFFMMLLIFFQQLQATVQTDGTSEDCQKLMDKGVAALETGELSKALEYYTKAEVLAKEGHWDDKLLVIKNDIGTIYNYLSNYGEALGYYRQALLIAENSKITAEIPRVLNNIGLLYHREKDYKNALDYYKRGYAISKTKGTNYTKVLLALNISDLYNKLNNFAEAKKYLDEVRSVPKSKKFEQGWKINYAESLLIEGKIAEAQAIIEDILGRVGDSKTVDCYVCVVKLLSEIYDRQHKTGLAISFAKNGLENTVELRDKVDFYNKLSNLYLKNGDCDTAFKYKDSVVIAKDSVSASISRGLFESNKIKLKVQEYQNELKVNQERQAAERKLIYSILIAFAAIVVTIILILRQKKIIAERSQKITFLELEKEKNENLLLEKQIKEKETDATLEQERLKNEIESRNRKLSAKALYLSGRNELIEEVIDSLSQIPQVTQNNELISYIKTLKNYLKTDIEWDEFITYFEQVNPGFLRTLQAKHPHLIAPDIRFLCYIYMNLDLREIGSIFNITYNAALKRQRRIKEKMEINKDITLYEYLLKLV